MSTTQKHLAVMFADITGSTSLYEKEGDERAFEMVSECLHDLIDKAKSVGGSHVKTIGDEIMVVFPDADTAFLAAREMQESLVGSPLSIRLGFHYGQVIPEGGDYYGDAVNVASRVASVATRDEVVTTGETVEKLSPENRENTRHLDTTTVKGRDEALDLYQVVWQTDELTIMSGDDDSLTMSGGPVLIVTYNDKEYTLDQNTTVFSIGREEGNDLVVEDSQASRRHAKIECKRGRFSLTDQSSNGTYAIKDDARTFLKRESIELAGSGVISLGRKPKSDAGQLIHYRCLN